FSKVADSLLVAGGPLCSPQLPPEHERTDAVKKTAVPLSQQERELFARRRPLHDVRYGRIGRDLRVSAQVVGDTERSFEVLQALFGQRDAVGAVRLFLGEKA